MFQVICKNQKRPHIFLFPQFQLHNKKKKEEKHEKGLIRAATVERIVSVASTTDGNQ